MSSVLHTVNYVSNCKPMGYLPWVWAWVGHRHKNSDAWKNPYLWCGYGFLWVWVWVLSKIPMGYPCRTLYRVCKCTVSQRCTSGIGSESGWIENGDGGHVAAVHAGPLVLCIHLACLLFCVYLTVKA